MSRETRTPFEIGPNPDQITEGNSAYNALRAVEDSLKSGTLDRARAAQQLRAVEQLYAREKPRLTEKQREDSEDVGFVDPARIVEVSAKAVEIIVNGPKDSRKEKNARLILEDAKKLMGYPTLEQSRGGDVEPLKVPNILGIDQRAWIGPEGRADVNALLDEFIRRRIKTTVVEQRDKEILLEVVRLISKAPPETSIGPARAEKSARVPTLVYGHALVLEKLVDENMGKPLPQDATAQDAFWSMKGLVNYDTEEALSTYYARKSGTKSTNYYGPPILEMPRKLTT